MHTKADTVISDVNNYTNIKYHPLLISQANSKNLGRHGTLLNLPKNSMILFFFFFVFFSARPLGASLDANFSYTISTSSLEPQCRKRLGLSGLFAATQALTSPCCRTEPRPGRVAGGEERPGLDKRVSVIIRLCLLSAARVPLQTSHHFPHLRAGQWSP